MTERQLVTLETIKELAPIDGADRLELATVRGWKVVVQKGLYNPGDEAYYFEVDSFLPIAMPQFAHLEPRGVKVMDGVSGHVLRTIKLRGQISQGMLVPVSEFPDGMPEIQKWEPPIPADLAGSVSGSFPYHFCPKTDAERIQNLDRVFDFIKSEKWTATEKIDGTSTTFINDGGNLRVATRNWEILPPSSRFDLAEKLDLLNKLPEGHSLQGEYFGEGIQGNPLGIKGQDFKAFALYRKTDNGPEYIAYDEWPAELVPLRVPVLPLELPDSIEGIVAQADGLMSSVAPSRRSEGIVWHGGRGYDFLGNRGGFKAINNTYLAKLKD